MAKGAAVGTAGHGQVVYRAETLKAGVAAELVHSAAENHFVFALKDDK